MKMIPSRHLAEIESSAEKKIFSVLEKINMPGWVCLHSVFLAEHDYQKSGEIDFLLLGPQGLLVLEIKGGRVRVDEKHIWIHTNRFGHETRRGKSPFKQAHDNMHSLINDLVVNKKEWRNLRVGYAVAFPDIVFDLESTEWTSEQILDVKDMSTQQSFEDGILKLLTYWGNKQFAPDLELDDVDQIVEFLRPRFDRVISLRTQIDQIKDQTHDLTHEQYRVLDMLQMNQRMICQGGAGTGKSFLALEFARRRSGAGKRTLLTAHSQILVGFLKRQLAVDGLTISTVDEVIDGEKFDVVIVDEGQDLMNQQAMSKIDKILSRGIESGEWAIFLDINSQADVISPVDKQVLERLKKNSVYAKLDRNCRNTMPIITQIQAVTGADLEDPKIALGPLVEYEDVGQGRENEVASLVAWLRKVVRSERVKPGEITVVAADNDLSWMEFLTPAFRSQIEVVDSESIRKWPFDQISAATSISFKGLENDAIAIVGLGGLVADSVSRNQMYVAMSRARALLWVAIPSSFGDDLSEKWKLI